MDVETGAYWILAAGLFPLWLAAGVADYLCHRQARIETTSGLPESISHLVLASLMGVAAMLLMLFEIDLFLLVVLSVLFAAHEAVTQWDLRWAVPRREVGAVEQQVHSFLEAIPFAALCVVALVVLSAGKFSLEPTLRPAPMPVAATILSAMTLFGAVPYWEEFWRCWRAHLRESGRDASRPSTSV